MQTKLFDLYKKMLEIHIVTKSEDAPFHFFTEGAYETLFDVFHTLSEREIDLSEKEMKEDQIEQKKIEAYDIIEAVKSELLKMVKEKNSIGMDNLLRSHIDNIEGLCGSSRAFLPKE